MLVKKIGILLIYKLKLYKLIKMLSLPLILLALVLPFIEWNLNNAKEKYQFQQPSLRTKIFDLNYAKSLIPETLNYHKVTFGTKAIVFQGMLPNECILLAFPVNFAQSAPIHMIYQTLKNDKALSKNVVLLSYQKVEHLNQFFKDFLTRNVSTNFGVIRVALNIEIQLRNKEKSKSTELKAFFEIYGKNEIRVDVDHFQSIKELLERLHIEWSSCDQIHEVNQLKIIKKAVIMVAQQLGTSKSKLSLFLDHLLCQGYRSFFSNYEKSHQVMMQYGFQSSSLTFLTSQPLSTTDNKVILNSEKISKLAYSFVKEYSMQEDHLHSSTTLFYPLDNNYFISLVGIIYPGVILLLVGAVHVLGYLVENSQNVQSTLTLLNLIEMVGFWFQLKINGKLDFTLCYVVMKLSSKIIISFFQLFKKARSTKISMEYFYCCALQFLLSVYFSIFNFSLFYFSSLLALLSLIRTKKTIAVLITSFFIVWITTNFDTIKSQIQVVYFSNLAELFENISFKFILLIKNFSLELQIIMIPFLYGTSTFLT